MALASVIFCASVRSEVVIAAVVGDSGEGCMSAGIWAESDYCVVMLAGVEAWSIVCAVYCDGWWAEPEVTVEYDSGDGLAAVVYVWTMWTAADSDCPSG